MEKERRLDRVDQLQFWFEQRGIRAVLFDLDDTLTKTNFRDGRLIFLRALQEISGKKLIDDQEFLDEWYQIYVTIKPQLGLYPAVHEYNSRLWAKYFEVDFDDPRVQLGFAEMWESIYGRVPENCQGAWETVQTVKQAGVDAYVVTHAEEEWTWKKMANWRGEFKRVFCIDVGGPKGVDQWAGVLKEIGLLPEKVVVVGDNVNADIKPTLALGVRYVIRVVNQWQWVEVPEGAMQVATTGDVIEALLGV